MPDVMKSGTQEQASAINVFGWCLCQPMAMHVFQSKDSPIEMDTADFYMQHTELCSSSLSFNNHS